MNYQIPWKETPDLYQNALEWAAKTGYQFKQPELLFEALTHRSAVKELATPTSDLAVSPWNERLEFLGDAILNYVIAELLFQKHLQWDEGMLSKRRAALVSAYPLAQLGLKLDLQTQMVVGAGMREDDRFRVNILADAVEAVIGAVYCDGGEQAARSWICRYWGDDVADLESVEQTVDFKTKFQEKVQELYRFTPDYYILKESGPAHRKTFIAQAKIDGEILGQGIGDSKKAATQKAAEEALKNFADFVARRGKKL